MKKTMVYTKANHFSNLEKMDCCCCKTVRIHMNTAYFYMY